MITAIQFFRVFKDPSSGGSVMMALRANFTLSVGTLTPAIAPPNTSALYGIYPYEIEVRALDTGKSIFFGRHDISSLHSYSEV